MSGHLVAWDIGSTGCKTCLYRFEETLVLVDSAFAGYRLERVAGGGVEQNPDDWWRAMVQTTREILRRHPGIGTDVEGASFCAQMQGLVLVDENLKPLRPAMSYLDQRATAELKSGLQHGVKIEGMNLRKLLVALSINGAVAASAKDPVWKYHWVRNHEPELFAKLYKWLDVKDYLAARAVGVCSMTADSAFATFLTGDRKGGGVGIRGDRRARGLEWNRTLLSLYDVDKNHLPPILTSTDRVGNLTDASAEELGLPAGIPVFGGGGDASLIGVGSGATELYDCHVYTGTSGWVSCVVPERKVDVSTRVAAITGAERDRYHFFAEQETAGKCLEWVRDHLAEDEINLYLNRHSVVDDPESGYRSMYDFLIESIGQVPPGSDGVIFAPWLHGNRSPFEDPSARGIFFNIGLGTGKRALIRAVVEGIIFHQRWLFEAVCAHFTPNEPIRFTGGGALSPAIAQIMADIFGRPIVAVADPQNTGAAGAAFCAAIGLGWLPGFEAVKRCVPVSRPFEPDSAVRGVYDNQYRVFKQIYRRNRGLFAALNSRAVKE